MTSVTQTAAFDDSTQGTSDSKTASYKGLSLPVQREVEHLTDVLFFSKSAPHRRSILMIDMDGGDESSLWLATGVASALGNLLRKMVYVLSVSPGDFTSKSPSRRIGQAVPDEKYFLEQIAGTTENGDAAGALTDRLATLQVESQFVIVHLAHLEERAAVLSRADSIEGVVLLIRASRTRRAAVEAIERQLHSANIPLLGSVLLDRIHPIPEKLYRLL